jgi:hypothetical protein
MVVNSKIYGTSCPFAISYISNQLCLSNFTLHAIESDLIRSTEFVPITGIILAGCASSQATAIAVGDVLWLFAIVFRKANNS